MDEYGLGRIASVSDAPRPWGRPAAGRRTLLLDAGRSRYVVRFEWERGEIEVKRELDLLLFLRRHRYPCPEPLPDRRNRHFRPLGGACIAFFKFIDGVAPPAAERTLKQIEAIGRALAELHAVGKGYKKGIENRFTIDRVGHLYASLRDGLPPYFRKIVRVLDEELEYLQAYLEGKLPKGVIHGGILEQNVLLRGSRVTGVLDFDAACRGKYIFDLAGCVNATCFVGGRYDRKRFEALIGGYESLRTLSLAEWDAFPNELRFSALRFTVTALRELLSLPDPEEGLAAVTEERGGTASAPTAGGDGRTLAVGHFQGFLDRLQILRREREGGMDAMLLAMATGYDYRRYQKVKAGERRAKS